MESVAYARQTFGNLPNYSELTNSAFRPQNYLPKYSERPQNQIKCQLSESRRQSLLAYKEKLILTQQRLLLQQRMASQQCALHCRKTAPKTESPFGSESQIYPIRRHPKELGNQETESRLWKQLTSKRQPRKNYSYVPPTFQNSSKRSKADDQEGWLEVSSGGYPTGSCSPRSVCSTIGNKSSDDGVISRETSTPSPTDSGSSKLYSLLKYPESTSYDLTSWDDGLTSRKRSYTLSEQSSVGDEAESPIDLSCKKIKLDYSQASADGSFSGSFLQSILAGHGKSCYSLDESSWGALLYSRNSPSSDVISDCNQSLLGRRTSEVCSPQQIEDRYSPVSLSAPASPATSTTSFASSNSGASANRLGQETVRLDKNLVLAITSRVTAWMVDIVKFAQSLPEFGKLSRNDRIDLLTHSWARMLLICMGESGFEFAVTSRPRRDFCNSPVPSITSDLEAGSMEDPQSNDLSNVPTMKHVREIRTFISKCQKLNLDMAEAQFLQMMVLFNPVDIYSLSPTDRQYFKDVSWSAGKACREYMKVTYGDDSLRYSRLLLTLPSLYSINSQMVANLFCADMADNVWTVLGQ